MKGKDLFSNIQQAREHITRLKREASLLESTPQEALATNIGDYMNEVIYTLNKNEHHIDKQHKQYKEKLPSIGKERDELPAIFAIKKHKNKIHSNSKHSRQQSTKVEDSFSFALQNRPMKMYSHHDRMKAHDFTAERRSRFNSQIDSSIYQAKQELQGSIPSSGHIRSRIYQKRAIKQRQFTSTKGGLNKSYLKPQSSKIVVSHDFEIIMGEIDTETRQFASYERVYESIFPKIFQQIKRIKQILGRQLIEYAKLDGKKLAYICLKDKISEKQLLSCLRDLPLLTAQSKSPLPQYFGKQGKNKAASVIASYWKMRNVRDKYLQLRNSTIVIQRFFRKKLMRLKLEQDVEERNARIMSDFQKRQHRFTKQFRNIKDQKRIQVHLASVEVDEEKRLSMDYFPQRQNVQLARIFRLRDPNLIIIFISSVDLSPQLLTYYNRMLELAGIDNYRERLIFLTPDLATRFPQHYSTAKLLYYSANTLNQLKIITSDLPTILYPGQPCNELLKICDIVDCYLYSGEPQRMKAFTTKSQTKRLLKKLCIQTLPYAMEMYDYGQFMNTFSVLITKNPSFQTWVLKIDDQIQGRGIAYADFSGSKFLKAVLRQLQYQDQQTFTTEVASNPQQQEATIRIRDYLRQHLHERLHIAAPSVYRGFTDFMGRFIKKGGIIEAHPACLSQKLATASVCFELTPQGEHHIITTYEKINGQPYRSLACSFPQQVMDHSKAVSTVRQLCDSFKIRKMFGVFTVDFLVEKEQSRHWVLGIDPFLNDYAASFHLFDMLMDGGYMQEKNVYLIDNQRQNTQQTEEASLQDRLATRQYVFIPHLHHKNLSKVKVKDFFKQARLQQFNFDVGNREGICVMLLDQLSSGLLGLLSVSSSRRQSTESIKKMLDFISKISSVKNVDYGKNQLAGSSDVITLKDVLSTFAGFARKGMRKNAKQRAIKQYELNRPLELI